MTRWLAVLLALWPLTARAGAWTQERGQWQLISTIGISQSARSFDSHGAAIVPDASRREMAQTYTQYGWRDGITFFAQTDTVYARTQTGSGVDNGLGGGVRLRLFHDDNSVVRSRSAGAAPEPIIFPSPPAATSPAMMARCGCCMAPASPGAA